MESSVVLKVNYILIIISYERIMKEKKHIPKHIPMTIPGWSTTTDTGLALTSPAVILLSRGISLVRQVFRASLVILIIIIIIITHFYSFIGIF